MTNRIELAAVLDRNKIPAGKEHTGYLLIKIRGTAADHRERLPLNLSFVLDRSGSMEGDKLEYTKQALATCINNLEAKDIQSLVLFDDQVEVLMAPAHLTNKDLAKQVIRQIWERGLTNLSGGVSRGARLVEQNLGPEYVSRIIVLTDGQANQGITDPAGLTKLAAKISKKGIGVTLIGVGEDFNEELLMAMAEGGRGNFYYIEDPDQIPAIFEQELHGLLQVVGQNLELTVAGLKVETAFGYEPVAEEGRLRFLLPDLYSGEEKILLLRFTLPALSPGEHKLAVLQFKYLDGESLEEQILTLPVDICSGEGEEYTGQAPDLEVESQVRRYRITEAQKEAMERADAGDFSQARSLLQEALEEMRLLAEIDSEAAEGIAVMESSLNYLQEENYQKSGRKNLSYARYKTQKNRR